jgi:hypothetical protein
LPKFHPRFDQAIKGILLGALNASVSDMLFVVLAGTPTPLPACLRIHHITTHRAFLSYA